MDRSVDSRAGRTAGSQQMAQENESSIGRRKFLRGAAGASAATFAASAVPGAPFASGVSDTDCGAGETSGDGVTSIATGRPASGAD